MLELERTPSLLKKSLQKLLEALGGPVVLVTELGVAPRITKSRSFLSLNTFCSIKFVLCKAVCE